MEDSRRDEVHFGPFRLDLAVGQLWRGNAPVELRPKATSVLVALVREAGVLVPRRKLIETAWGDTHVDGETALHKVIGEIRRALGDDPAEARYVATVHRRGYRFVAEIVPEPDSPPAEPTTDVQANALEAEPTTRRRSGLVAAAIALTALAGVAGVSWLSDDPVVSEHPALEASTDILLARALLDSGQQADVHRAAELLRTAVRREDSALAWSGLAVAEFRLARYAEGVRAAFRALELDPTDVNARRFVGLQRLVEGRLEEAEEHLLRALALDRHSGRAHHAWGLYQASIGNIERAIDAARTAVALDPTELDRRVNLALFLFYGGEFEAAVEQARFHRTVEDPVEGARRAMLLTEQAASWMLGDRHASREALAEFARRAGAPERTVGGMLDAPADQGIERGLRWWLAFMDPTTHPDPYVVARAALMQLQLGDVAAARRTLARLGSADRLPRFPEWLNDPRLEAVADSPEMDRILERYREKGFDL